MSTTYDRSSGYYDFWQQWEQRNVTEQAQAQIARRELTFQAWADEMRHNIAHYTEARSFKWAAHCQAVLEQATAQYMREIAEMQMQAEQQIAEIDTRYGVEAIERERSDAESRDRWANTPNNTPRSPLPDWTEGYTPAPAYGPRNAADMPLDTTADAPEQEVSFIDRLFSLFS